MARDGVVGAAVEVVADPVGAELIGVLRVIELAGDFDAELVVEPEQPLSATAAVANTTEDSFVRDGHMLRERIRSVG